MGTLFAFGDSFVVGDQDDFGSKSHGMNYNTRVEYLKYNVSFVSILAKYKNYNLKNFAECGSGNFPQLDLLMTSVLSNQITKDDVIFFGLTTFARDRSNLVLNKKYLRFYKNKGSAILHQTTARELLTLDYLYVMNTLTFVNDTLKIPVVVINLFDSADCKIQYDIQIGSGQPGNTLINVLNDTWGQATQHDYHSYLKIPKGYEHLYTKNKHPSVQGHQKIADWLQKLNTI